MSKNIKIPYHIYSSIKRTYEDWDSTANLPNDVRMLIDVVLRPPISLIRRSDWFEPIRSEVVSYGIMATIDVDYIPKNKCCRVKIDDITRYDIFPKNQKIYDYTQKTWSQFDPRDYTTVIGNLMNQSWVSE